MNKESLIMQNKRPRYGIEDYTKVFGREGMPGGIGTMYWKVDKFYFWLRYAPMKRYETRWTSSTLYSHQVDIEEVLNKLPPKFANLIIFNLDLFR